MEHGVGVSVRLLVIWCWFSSLTRFLPALTLAFQTGLLAIPHHDKHAPASGLLHLLQPCRGVPFLCKSRWLNPLILSGVGLNITSSEKLSWHTVCKRGRAITLQPLNLMLLFLSQLLSPLDLQNMWWLILLLSLPSAISFRWPGFCVFTFELSAPSD